MTQLSPTELQPLLSVVSRLTSVLSWTSVVQAVIVVCGLSGNVLINRKDARGFYLWLVANGLLVVIQAVTGMYLLMGLYIAYFGLSAHGLVQWRRESKPLP